MLLTEYAELGAYANRAWQVTFGTTQRAVVALAHVATFLAQVLLALVDLGVRGIFTVALCFTLLVKKEDVMLDVMEGLGAVEGSLSTQFVDNISSVLFIPFKMALLHAPVTFAATQAFGAPFPSFAALLSLALGAVPIVYPFLVSVPWALELWLVEGKFLHGLLYFIVHYVAFDQIDGWIQGKVHAVDGYVTGLSIFFGVSAFGRHGVITGPLLVSFFWILTKTLRQSLGSVQAGAPDRLLPMAPGFVLDDGQESPPPRKLSDVAEEGEDDEMATAAVKEEEEEASVTPPRSSPIGSTSPPATDEGRPRRRSPLLRSHSWNDTRRRVSLVSKSDPSLVDTDDAPATPAGGDERWFFGKRVSPLPRTQSTIGVWVTAFRHGGESLFRRWRTGNVPQASPPLSHEGPANRVRRESRAKRAPFSSPNAAQQRRLSEPWSRPDGDNASEGSPDSQPLAATATGGNDVGAHHSSEEDGGSTG